MSFAIVSYFFDKGLFSFGHFIMKMPDYRVMKIVSLVCPYCSGQINLHEDHKFGECLYCGHKVMLINDEVKRDERSDVSYPEFESVRYCIESGDVRAANKLFAEKYRDNENSPHGWLLCGFIQLMGGKPFDTSALKKILNRNDSIDAETKIQTALSSWKRAFSTLDNQYYLTDYCSTIGAAMANMGYELDSNKDRMIAGLEDVLVSIESHFNISFAADFYYSLMKGLAAHLDKNELYDKDTFAFELMSHVIMYEPDIDALAIKSQLLNRNVLSEISVEKDECIFFVLSLIYAEAKRSLTMEEKKAISEGWNEKELYSQLSSKWKSLMVDDYEFFDVEELKDMCDNIGDYVKFDEVDESQEEEVSEEAADLSRYEHIEETTSFKDKVTKKRSFTQYIVIDGCLYTRGLTLSRKEFDGSLDRISDLNNLKSIFEKEYEDIVVGADSCYMKVSKLEMEMMDQIDSMGETELDDESAISEELDGLLGDALSFVNILLKKAS